MKYALITSILDGNVIDVVDVGCAFGPPQCFSPIKKNISLYGFDPFSEGGRLEGGAFHGLNSCKIICKALWNVRGKRLFHVTQKSACSSLLEPSQEFAITHGMQDKFKIIKTIEVDVTTLDSELETTDYLKVDAQGGAYEVLSGANKLLSTCLVVEVECEFYELYNGQKTFSDIIKFMADNGYVLAGFNDLKYLPGGFKRNSNFLAYGDVCFYNISMANSMSGERLRKLLAIGIALNNVPILNFSLPLVEKTNVLYKRDLLKVKLLMKLLWIKDRVLRYFGVNM